MRRVTSYTVVIELDDNASSEEIAEARIALDDLGIHTAMQAFAVALVKSRYATCDASVYVSEA